MLICLRSPLAATAFVAGVLTTGPALVHPHVLAEARLDVTVAADNTVRSLKHLWRFDDLFSSTVLVEFDKNQDLELDQAELQTLAGVIAGSLAEFDYFQLVTADGKDVKMRPPGALVADFQDNQLMILFESAPEQSLKLAGKISFGVYDPTFYTAIDFIEDENMAVQGMPPVCTRAVIRPDPDEAIAQNQATLTEEFFNQPGGNDLSRIFATRLELTCKAQG
jgi:ABC-type uncharacterized transport system substrate-binding protein